ncbi:unnamed protein product [Meganyctiphanes norvegica]|uniref:Oplophorus-luciferin 2-monooxygenase non-catalytic subunit n=1 Tax=Meganyctiphanes norvegica TaxID=48144 RepID=A0AAV2PPD4_MEGNR
MQSQMITLAYAVFACLSTDGKQFSGQVNGHANLISSNVYNQSKEQLMQDSHNPQYYGTEQPCPDAEDIAPCVCTYDSERNVVDLDCSKVESEDQLKQIFEADFPLRKIETFTINSNNNIKILESGVFNGVSFVNILISYSVLEVIELNAFDSCYEVATGISLLHNYNLVSFPFDSVSHFSKLISFVMKFGYLSMIPADIFDGLTTLEHLDISANTASIIGTFDDLPNLQFISIQNNHLSSIPTNFIKTGSSKLEYIFLEYNSIVSVEPGAFDVVDGLQIYMSFNSLSTLEEATWRPYLEAGGVLYAYDNPLSCGCDIAWLFGEDQLLEQVDNTRCSDGEYLHDVDPSTFDNC